MGRFILVLAGSTILAGSVPAVETPFPGRARNDGPVEEMTPAQKRAIARGFDWLVRTQNLDGLWGCERSGAPSTAITGLAVLAFAASGSTPSAGPHADPIRRGVDRLLVLQTASGQITRYDSTGMGVFYDHSCAALALAEVYGMRRSEGDFRDVRCALDAAIRFMYSVQNPDGGWGPQGLGSGSDIAVTCNVWMALRAAHNAGITIELARMDKVEEFVRGCALPTGGFDHAPTVRGGGGRLFYPTTAGLRVLYGMGKRDLKEVEKGAELILDRRMGQDYGNRISEWDYVGAFYAVQGFMHEGGKYWRKWWPKFRDRLVTVQNPDGSWTIEYCKCCRAYATALALLALQAPQRLLPLFQL